MRKLFSHLFFWLGMGCLVIAAEFNQETAKKNVVEFIDKMKAEL